MKNSQVQHLHFCRQALATLAASLTPLCGGMTLGITAVMLPQLRRDSSIGYDPSSDSWIASISSISMIFGSLACGTIVDTYGRKAAQIFIQFPLILGWIFIACANSTGLILAGLFAGGFSSCAIRITTVTYIGEITEPKLRSAALYIPSLLGYVGVLSSHIVGYYLPWKISAAVCIVPVMISFISCLFLRESPLWLISKGRTEEGIENFRWFRGTGEAAETELRTVFEKQAVKPKISVRTTFKIARKMSFIKPMLVLLVVMLDIQLSGVNVIGLYPQDIFERSFSGKVDPFLLMIAMDCIRGVISLICCVLGKFVSKKKAFLASNFGVTVFIFGLVLSFYFLKLNYVWVHVTCFVMYLCFSSIIVTVGWSFVPEVLPNCARGFGSGINATFAYLSLFVIAKLTPDIMDSLGEPALFAGFGISTFACGLVLAIILPETNGKTLQSIEDSYVNKKDDMT